MSTADEAAAEQQAEREPMVARDDDLQEVALPGQPATVVVEDEAAPEPAAIGDIIEGASEHREPTVAEELSNTDPKLLPDAEQPAPRAKDSWDFDDDEDADLCAVCQAPCSDTPLNCGHALHPQCLAEWTLSNAQQRGNCPTCRQPLASRPRSPTDRRSPPTTPPLPRLESDLEPEPEQQAAEIPVAPRVDVRKLVRYGLRITALATVVTLSMLTIFTCQLSGDICCSVDCDGDRAPARYRYANGTCVCAEAERIGQERPRCDHWQYPGQRLLRSPDSDARCVASALENRLVEPGGAMKGTQRYLIVPTVGATCESAGLRSLNGTFECESVLRAANNDYARRNGLGHRALTQVRRGLGENTLRYMYHVERGQMFNREDAPPGSRHTGWYRKRTPYYAAADCGAATFIEGSNTKRIFRMSSHEADVRANTDNPRYAPQIEWTGFDGPHPVDGAVGVPVDIADGWNFIPPVLNTAERAAAEPYMQAVEGAALQNEAFAQGHVAAVFCVAPADLEDAPVGGFCAQEPLSYFGLFWWFALCPLMVVSAVLLKKLEKTVAFVRTVVAISVWLIYLWITAAQCSQGGTALVKAEVGVLTLLLICSVCVCMCKMPCCSNDRHR